MYKCSECGKDLLKKKPLYDDYGNFYCSEECRIKHKNPFRMLKRAFIPNEFNTFNIGKIKEIKCECRECGAIWHYLPKDEKKLKNQAALNACGGCGYGCTPFGAFFSNKSLELRKEARKMKKCPKCGSVNMKKSTLYHEKRP